ncbi:hypothetical protein [Brevibacillus reuszeri]|uniref:hypothetical protein n=1 Tax=Brevibacillus reuszeri TaxID=54915 RepID=UPI0013DED6CA|nr:hypothetical protein [Brevibacillus reuszeri]
MMNQDKKKKLVVLDEAHTHFPKISEESKKILNDVYEKGKPIGYQSKMLKQRLE